MSETGKTAESPAFKLSDFFSQLGIGEIKHEPQEPNSMKLEVLGVVENRVTRRMFSISEDFRLSVGDIVGGPVEQLDELIDNMPGPAKRQALKKLKELAEQALPVKDLFWALVKEEIPQPDGCSGIAIFKGWEVAALPAEENSEICMALESMVAPAIIAALKRRARTGATA